MGLLKKLGNDSVAASAEEASSYESTTGASRRKSVRQAWRVVLPSLLFIFVALMFAAHSLARRHSNVDAEYVALMNELKLRSQQVSRDAQSAVLGGVQGLARLKAHGTDMQTMLNRLRNGDAVGPLPPLPARVAPQLAAVENTWRGMRENIDTILTGAQVAAAMRENGKSLEALFSSARLTTQEVFGAVVSGTASAEQVSLVGRQLVRLERMSIDVKRTLEGGTDTAAAALGGTGPARRGRGSATGNRAPGESVRQSFRTDRCLHRPVGVAVAIARSGKHDQC
jgi:hypothetical protein